MAISEAGTLRPSRTLRHGGVLRRGHVIKRHGQEEAGDKTHGEEPTPSAVTDVDALLLCLVAKGDRDAFKLLYSSTATKLLAICLRILADRQEAEGAMQEAYLSVWKRAGTFDPARGTALTWLGTIAHNRAVDRLRQLRAHPTEGIDAAIKNIPSGMPDALDTALLHADQADLIRCLKLIDPDDAELIRNAFLEEISYPELADRLNLPLGTVKSRIRRALIRLRGLLR